MEHACPCSNDDAIEEKKPPILSYIDELVSVGVDSMGVDSAFMTQLVGVTTVPTPIGPTY
jgi:hypothetical protein